MRSDRLERRRVERIVVALQYHESAEVQAAGNEMLRWLMNGRREPLERVLGLRPAPGQRSGHTVALLSRRDQLVQRAASRFYLSDMPQSAVAAQMHKDWQRYASSIWPRERTIRQLSDKRANTLQGAFWQLLRLQDKVLAERTIRQILAGS